MTRLIPYLVTLFSFLILGAIWLGLIARPFYRAQIGFLLAKKANWVAGVFHLLYAAGLVFFVVEPALRARATPGRPALRAPFSAWWPMPPTT
jgi:uncharacterized membrane protein